MSGEKFTFGNTEACVYLFDKLSSDKRKIGKTQRFISQFCKKLNDIVKIDTETFATLSLLILKNYIEKVDELNSFLLIEKDLIKNVLKYYYRQKLTENKISS